MTTRTPVFSTLPVAVTAALLALWGSTAFCQDVKQEVRIEAGKIVTIKEGHSPTGIQVERVQLTRNVSFKDLDLTTPGGASELEQRIHDSADSVCKQLKDINPTNSAQNEEMDQKTCVNGAVKSAMRQMKHAVASAGEARKRG